MELTRRDLLASLAAAVAIKALPATPVAAPTFVVSDYTLEILAGHGAGQRFKILSSTDTVITLAAACATTLNGEYPTGQ